MPASGLQNAVHLIWHLPRLASWHCAGWLLHCHWILNGNYAVYTAFVYIYIYIYICMCIRRVSGDSSICMFFIVPVRVMVLLHLAFASARLVPLRRLVAGWALYFEQQLCSVLAL